MYDIIEEFIYCFVILLDINQPNFAISSVSQIQIYIDLIFLNQFYLGYTHIIDTPEGIIGYTFNFN